MDHYIFSDSMEIAHCADTVHIEKRNLDRIHEIRQQADTDIYLCGGGTLAGWLLDHGLIDRLKLKLNPIVLGGGTKLFGPSKTKAQWDLVDVESFADGLQILTCNKKDER